MYFSTQFTVTIYSVLSFDILVFLELANPQCFQTCLFLLYFGCDFWLHFSILSHWFLILKLRVTLFDGIWSQISFGGMIEYSSLLVKKLDGQWVHCSHCILDPIEPVADLQSVALSFLIIHVLSILCKP